LAGRYEKPANCYCDEDQGAGYTYSDEHGDCDVCERERYITLSIDNLSRIRDLRERDFPGCTTDAIIIELLNFYETGNND